jgi:glucuronyl/N-acetylglucosaminyl transferase EXT2
MTETSLDGGKLSMFKKLELKPYQSRFQMFDMCTPNNSYFERCVQNEIHSYPVILGDSVFCVITETYNHAYLLSLFDALKFNCIPVVVFDELILPFEEKIDWKSAVIRIRESHIMNLIDIIDNINADVVDMMLNYIQTVYTRYYSSIENITLTTLDILDSRIYKKTT